MATDRQIAAYRVNEAGVSAGNSFLTKRTRQVQVSQGFRRSRVPILNLPKPRPNPVKPTGNPLKPKANPRKPRPTALTCNFPVNAVEFHRVSKTYRIYESPADRLRELAAFNRRSHHREFQALRDLSFTIRSGEVFCIVGENGSGKSTSLRLMAGIAEPTSGEVRTTGRVAALLELGAGFNPEFSGRENAYLNASILGLSKREIDARYRSIEEFAEIGDFIDQPVKTYSSGMAVRLAFAVAISVDPEILIVDEALAVGDTYFRHRCMRKVRELRSRGVTIVFVSHSIADVKAIGERVLWLRHGEAVAMGDTDTVIAQYLAEMTDQPVRSPRAALTRIDTIPNIDHRHGDGSRNHTRHRGHQRIQRTAAPHDARQPHRRPHHLPGHTSPSPLPKSASFCAITSASISRSPRHSLPATASGRNPHRRLRTGNPRTLPRVVFVFALEKSG